MRKFYLFALFVSLLSAQFSVAQTREKKTLTLDGARKVIAAALAEAKAKNAPGAAVAVVDDGGNVLAVERLDGTFAAGSLISIGKARTSALFQRPTKVFEDIIRNGRTSMVALPDSLFTPLQGGVPIMVDGQLVGAIGVSGAASAQQDEELAMAGSQTFAGMAMSSGDPVFYLESGKVTAAFQQGMPLLEVAGYKIHASRRDGPGKAEVHTRDTDIIYVLGGTATLVTGGAVVDGKEIAPEEIRGTSIRDGEARQLRAGDVMVVPNGTPHWFQQVDAPFTYYVVKVTEAGR